MTAPHTNRPMFRRLIRRLLFANRGRLFVILLALSAGAAVSAALLNLQTDAKRRITTEFRSFGANVLITPRVSSSLNLDRAAPSLDARLFEQVPETIGRDIISKASLLYGLADVTVVYEIPANPHAPVPMVVVGEQLTGARFSDIFPNSEKESTYTGPILAMLPCGSETCESEIRSCWLGENAAAKLHVHTEDLINLRSEKSTLTCYVGKIYRFGGQEDNQVFVDLGRAQALLHQPGRISMIAVSAPGEAKSMERLLHNLRSTIPDAEVRPLRQFSEAQAKIYSRISGLLTASTALILVLTGLCVMAAMTNIAAERKHDVGMMKAIGGSARGILNLFLTEAALLGLAGGLIGAAAGIALSMALGKAVFGIAAAPRLIVYPISVLLTVIVAILGAYPLRRLANVRPATIFRGDA